MSFEETASLYGRDAPAKSPLVISAHPKALSVLQSDIQRLIVLDAMEMIQDS